MEQNERTNVWKINDNNNYTTNLNKCLGACKQAYLCSICLT